MGLNTSVVYDVAILLVGLSWGSVPVHGEGDERDQTVNQLDGRRFLYISRFTGRSERLALISSDVTRRFL